MRHEPLAHLTAMEGFDLSGTKVTDLSPAAPLTALGWLVVPAATTSEAQAKALKLSLPNCTIYRP